MRINIGEVRRLKTKSDIVLITAINPSYVTVVPVFSGRKTMVGRYFDFRDVQFALDFPARINYELLGEFIYRIPDHLTPKIGRDVPSKFKDVIDRQQLLTYIDSEDDIRRVLEAEGNL